MAPHASARGRAVAPTAVPDADALRRAFAEPCPPTVGIEDEVWLLDRDSLDLLPRADAVLARDDPAARPAAKGEFPLAQLELATAPAATVGEAAASLRSGRERLAVAAEGIGRLAAIGVHPCGPVEGAVREEGRYAGIAAEYGWAARRQLVAALQVHVAIRPVERALAVVGSLRGHLPELLALAANAPHHGGADTGLATVRPKLADALPRQAVPPALATVEEYAGALAWAAASGGITDAGQWWWEVRLHPSFGTVEVRVGDAQPTVAAAAAVAAVVQALCVTLAERHDAGDLPPPAPTWRIAQNRWSACRHGVDGTLADLDTGEPLATRERLHLLLAALRPAATALGCARELACARRLIDDPASARHRAIASAAGLPGLLRQLVEDFLS